ncbi:zinc finger, CCHC-type [Artemisia annua]|uniref:Zinc finger, CCHC-type n=1 Tax=Artemisia annua TaxID=35608 RepID=A0A2U1PEI8_ARTAN|nr:zinc finger, CCHC-type [Artemisia annua]
MVSGIESRVELKIIDHSYLKWQQINPSAIRFLGVSSKRKLTGSNFLDLYRNLRIVLTVEDKLTYVEHPILATLVRPTPDQQDLARLMLISKTPELQKNLEHFGTYGMLKELKIMFAQQVEQELFETVQAFHACKHEEGQSVSTYVLKMKIYLDRLERLGQPTSSGLAILLEFWSHAFEHKTSYVLGFFIPLEPVDQELEEHEWHIWDAPHRSTYLGL